MEEAFEKAFQVNFSFVRTNDQDAAHHGFKAFLNSDDDIFVLKGYAGTGKTSLISAWVHSLKAIKRSSILMAPTGRAAKVFSSYAKTPAFTIHKRIYMPQKGPDGQMFFRLAKNTYKDAVIFVDEASMIATNSGVTLNAFLDRHLLDDLYSFVKEGYNCKLVLIGDDFQLPPVHMDESPALQIEYLKDRYHTKIHHYMLSQVIRQDQESGILFNANLLRKNGDKIPQFKIKNFPDVELITGSQLHEKIDDVYNEFGEDETLVVTRSNKMANLYNNQIRSRILWHEESLSQNDRLMVVRNNYFWIEQDDPFGFIANGDTVILKRVLGHIHLYGFDFINVIVKMVDFPNAPEKEVLILKDALQCEGPSIPRETLKKLFYEIELDFEHIHNKRKRYDEVMKTPHFNALQMKFAYAVTCHKSQGGQWDAVFVDMGFLPEDISQLEQNRWLYTAITRAKKKLYLVNFPEQYFAEGEYFVDW